MATSFALDSKPVPGPTPWFPGASFLKFRRDPLAFFTETQRTYGDIARITFGPQQLFLVSHPDWIEDVLVTSAKKFSKGVALQRAKRLLGEGLLTSEGQAHLKQRRTIQPLFHRQQVQRFADAMVTHALRWRESIEPERDASTSPRKWARSRWRSSARRCSRATSRPTPMKCATRSAKRCRASRIAFVPFFNVLEKLPLPIFARVRRARERLDRVIHRVIAERRANGDAGGDLVSMLLAARDPENPDAAGMSDEQIRDEAMTIFLAGHETTANAMAWTWHLLGSAPEVEARLHEELDRVLGSDKPRFAPGASAHRLSHATVRWRTCRSSNGPARLSPSRCAFTRRPGRWAGARSSRTRLAAIRSRRAIW